MAHPSYMTITGRQQGLISAGCSSQDSIGNKCQTTHLDEIMVLSFQHSMSNVDNLTRATHEPILITKNVDKSSPLLAQALTNREVLDCVIAFYRVSASGMQEKFFSLELNGCQLAYLHFDMPHALKQDGDDAQEHIAFRYRDIRWTHHIAGTTGSTSWGEHE